MDFGLRIWTQTQDFGVRLFNFKTSRNGFNADSALARSHSWVRLAQQQAETARRRREKKKKRGRRKNKNGKKEKTEKFTKDI